MDLTVGLIIFMHTSSPAKSNSCNCHQVMRRWIKVLFLLYWAHTVLIPQWVTDFLTGQSEPFICTLTLYLAITDIFHTVNSVSQLDVLATCFNQSNFAMTSNKNHLFSVRHKIVAFWGAFSCYYNAAFPLLPFLHLLCSSVCMFQKWNDKVKMEK